MGASEHPIDPVWGFGESAEDLYENAPCGYLSAAPDGTLIRVNATFLRWTGYRAAELVGVKRFKDLLTAGGRIYHETHYAPMLQMQDAVREIAVDIVGADGGRLPVLVNSVLLRDDAGEPQVIRTTVFDATERKSYERELLAARDRERGARESVEHLQRITAALAAAADATAIASVLTAELVPAFGANAAAVVVRDPATRERLVLADHGDGAPGSDESLGPAADFDEGEGDRGAAVRLPLGAGPSVNAWLWLHWAEPRSFQAQERAFLLGCAGQTGLALERARLYEETRDVALSLQRSLLAGAPPPDPRFEVATLYHPAIEHLEVGGDWHDVFTLSEGRVGIVVGDVVGRGLAAASAMGQLRSAVRALAGAGLQPGAILRHLDTFVEQVDTARYATLAYAEAAPDTGRVTFASAGHLPPVLLEPGCAPQAFMEGRSTPLGVTAVDRPERPQAAVTLAPGAGFLLYTDGLVERRREPIDAGIERLLAAIADAPDRTPAGMISFLPDALLEGGITDDDVCLLGFRLCEHA